MWNFTAGGRGKLSGWKERKMEHGKQEIGKGAGFKSYWGVGTQSLAC